MNNNFHFHNRSTRRAAAKYFSDLAKEGWGEWEEVLPEKWWKSPIKPIKGLTKFIKNNVYSVQFVEHEGTEWGTITRLLIRRHDTKTAVPWSHKQRIKNELCGLESVAVEVFPPESKLFDEANIYHLWIIPACVNLPVVL